MYLLVLAAIVCSVSLFSSGDITSGVFTLIIGIYFTIDCVQDYWEYDQEINSNFAIDFDNTSFGPVLPSEDFIQNEHVHFLQVGDNVEVYQWNRLFEQWDLVADVPSIQEEQ